MPTANTPQIAVSTGSISAGIAAAMRYLFVTLLTLAASRGWLPADSVGEVAGYLVAAVTAGYGIWQTTRRQSDLITVAKAAPNAVAVAEKSLS